VFSLLSIIKKVQTSQFFRNVAKLSSGKLFALAIAVVATPIVSRLFDPSDYGVAALFIAASTIAASVLALAYERAAIFPKDDYKANRVVYLALSVSAGLALLILLVIVTCYLVLPEFVEGSNLGRFIWLLPLGAFLMSVKSAGVALCVRRNDYTAIATADVGEAAITASTRIFWGLLLTSSTAGLLTGHLLGILFAGLACGLRSRAWLKKAGRPPGFREMWSIAVEFKDYPQLRAPAKIAFSASRKLPVIALGVMFPAEVVGFYAMANRAAGRPLQAVSKSVSDVLLGKTMKLRHVGKPLSKSLVKVAAVLVLTGIPIFSVMLVYGEELLAWFLGARWSDAGIYVQIMAPYLFALWVGSFTSTVFETLRLNKIRLKLNTGSLLIRIVVFVACSAAGFDIVATLWVFVITSCLYQVMTYLIAASAVVKYDAALLRNDLATDTANAGESS